MVGTGEERAEKTENAQETLLLQPPTDSLSNDFKAQEHKNLTEQQVVLGTFTGIYYKKWETSFSLS